MFKKITYPKLEEKIYYRYLNNGMKVYFLPDDSAAFLEARLIINFGAYHLFYDDFKLPPGTAHFLEHMMFKMPKEDAITAFSKLGAEANAETSYQGTTYMFDTTDNFYESLALLFKMIDNPHFINKAIAKEKSIIIEEINMYKSDIFEEIENIVAKNTYHNHPFRFDIGGDTSDISAINQEILTKAYLAGYRPANRILVIGGNLDLTVFDSFLDKYDQNTKYLPINKPIEIDEPASVVRAYEEISRNVSIDIIIMKIKIATLNNTVKDGFIANIVLGMLFGKESDFYENLLSDGLIGSSFRYYANIECNAYDITVENSCNRADDYLTHLKEIIFKTDFSFFTLEAFNRYKKAFLGRFIFSLNTLKSRVRLFCEYIINDCMSYDILDIIKEITLEDCLSMFAVIKTNPFTVLKVNRSNK